MATIKYTAPPAWFVRCMLYAGAVMVPVAAALCAWTAYDVTVAERVEGRVVELANSSEHVGWWRAGARRGRGLAPVVEYEVNGLWHRASGNIFASPPNYHVGDKVQVRYFASNPTKGRIDTPGETWTPSVTLLALGLLMGGFGLFSPRLSRRTKPTA